MVCHSTSSESYKNKLGYKDEMSALTERVAYVRRVRMERGIGVSSARNTGSKAQVRRDQVNSWCWTIKTVGELL